MTCTVNEISGVRLDNPYLDYLTCLNKYIPITNSILLLMLSLQIIQTANKLCNFNNILHWQEK